MGTATGVAHFHYKDKCGNPCLVIHSQNHKKRERDLNMMVSFVIFLVEHGLRSVLPQQKKFVAIFDYTGFSSKNSDLELAKQLITLMNNYFPERLEIVYLLNYPWALSMLWSVVEPLLDVRTRKKILFAKRKELLLEKFNESSLLPQHGGTSNYKPSPNSL